jgi:two-component system, OmpR family, alkaline phosphatase synthesis response regulator PhoP
MPKRVLIADDEPNIVAALEFLLQRNGYEVYIARDGDEALGLIELHKPDLVLLDLKIIMLSAKGREVEVNKGVSLGADLYITKPFSTRELVAKINGLLGAGP